MRGVWQAISAISTGFGIWATHFVAMLAFMPGIPIRYDISLTILSLVAAILLTGAGLAVSFTPNGRHGAWMGGHRCRWHCLTECNSESAVFTPYDAALPVHPI